MEAHGLRKTYESEGAPVRALRGVDMAMEQGEFVAIMGPSGCGKSTLLNLVAGLDVPSEGEIVVAGEALSGMDESALARMRRRHIGIVFQFFNLLEGMSVLENVTLPAVIAGTGRKRAESRARDLLDLLGLADKAKSAPGVLSGGQRQRLAIARALANAPTLVLADEPTGRSDSEGGREVLELFRRLHAGGQSILLVTHDESVAAPATRIVRMRDGRVEGEEAAAGASSSTGAVAATTYERTMSAPIIVSQLGHVRESARAPTGTRAPPRTTRPRPLMTVSSSLLAAVAVAGGVAAPLVDENGDLATQVLAGGRGRFLCRRRADRPAPPPGREAAAPGAAVCGSGWSGHGPCLDRRRPRHGAVEARPLSPWPISPSRWHWPSYRSRPCTSCSAYRTGAASSAGLRLPAATSSALPLGWCSGHSGHPPTLARLDRGGDRRPGRSWRLAATLRPLDRARTPTHAVVRVGDGCGPGDAAGVAGTVGPRRLARSSLPGPHGGAPSLCGSRGDVQHAVVLPAGSTGSSPTPFRSPG